jgi:hypothetical protein
LNDKPFDDPVERRIVEVAVLCKTDEVVDRHWSVIRKELDLNRALVRFQAP